MALSPPRSLPVDVIAVQSEFWEEEALVLRPDIRSPAQLRGRTIASPRGSTSHYQLLYLLDILNLREDVTVVPAQPSELAALWRRNLIDGAYVWAPHLQELRDEFDAVTFASGGGVTRLGAPTFVAYVLRRSALLPFSTVRDALRALIAGPSQSIGASAY